MDYVNYGATSKRLVDSIASQTVDVGDLLLPTFGVLLVVGVYAVFAYKIASEGRWLGQFND
jgi:hypothetical protein